MRRMISASVFGHAAPRAMHVPERARASVSAQSVPPSAAATPAAETTDEPSASRTSLADVERAHIEKVLAELEGNVTQAANALGIDRRTLQRKLKSYGIE